MKEINVVEDTYKDLHDEIKKLRSFVQTVHDTNDKILNAMPTPTEFAVDANYFVPFYIYGDEIKTLLNLINYQIKSEFLR